LGIALQNASVRIDGDFLIVSLRPEHAADKSQFDKDKKQLLEEVAREITGRRLTLSLSVGAEAAPEGAPTRAASEPRRKSVEIPEGVQALADKFGAEKVEIIKPDLP